MILDKRNSKIPYGIAIIGSVALLAIYVASRTIGISSLGLEPVGLLDLIVGMLQGGIIAGIYSDYQDIQYSGTTI